MLTRSAANAKRVSERLDELYAIGGGPGANRPGGSAAEQEACDVAMRWMEEAGLAVECDARGNLVGRLPGRNPSLPEIWAGSHLDSVPEGGRFDGALGVVAALEAVERVGRSDRTFGVAVFRDEETGCHGSRARVRTGVLPGAFLEVHVEQGPVLAEADAPLGVVTSIAGIARAERTFTGRAGHAGTTPMGAREDALVAAAEYVVRVRDVAGSIDAAVATIGRVDVHPGAANVIPDRVTVTVDARAPDGDRLDRLVEELELEPFYRIEPVELAPELRAVLAAELAQRQLPVVELPSGAGHDAGVLANAGVRSAMLFVRSLNRGASHSPDELSSDEDIALAVDVLTAALGRLAVAP